ncbi:hypothetical protein BROUX41_002065 [Berkeleyomyces rouxiae]|uniref:uncharacterized protein n=1 Tax=Berkeleyomyces rouxiae TaxID=2035830 RepID=UPI003B75D90E
MSAEPSDGAIQEVVEFTAFGDRIVISRALKTNNNDTMRVVQEYFEDAEAFKMKYTWDNPVFPTDNDSTPQQGISFHIESAARPAGERPATPEQNDAYYERLALSRPPSRTANPSPVNSNRVSDWRLGMDSSNLDNYKYNPLHDDSLPPAMSQEEDDLQKALRLSAQESGIDIDNQEMGIMNSASPLHSTETMADAAAPPPTVSFGPARMEEYPENNWAMVSVSVDKYAAPQIDTIKPVARRRPYDAPAVLILANKSGGISTQDRLGGIITVLHSIPLARNILLGGASGNSYGHHHDWWKGAPILKAAAEHTQPPTNADADPDALPRSDSDMDWAAQSAGVSATDELHRLLGLLEMSERSFGTINSLSDALGGNYNLEARFFDFLADSDRKAAQPLLTVVRHREISHLQNLEQPSTEGQKDSNSALESDDPDVNNEDDFQQTQVTYIEAEVNTSSWPYVQSLTDIWDHVMWNDTVNFNIRPHAKSGMTSIEKQGDVLAMHINTEGREAPFEIPREFSVERYMSSRRKEAIGLMEMLVDHKQCLIKAEERLASLCAVPSQTSGTNTGPSSASGTVSPAAALSHYETQIRDYEAQMRYISDRSRFRTFAEADFDERKFPLGLDSAPLNLEPQEQSLMDVLTHTVDVLKKKHAHVTMDVENLQKHIAFHQEQLRQISTMYTDPEKPRPKPFVSRLMHLRGVVCDDGVVYLCQRQEPKLVDLSTESNVGPVDQWWRLHVMPDATPAVKSEKVEWERIIRSVWHEGQNPLLIYATEAALAATPLPLSDTLAKFVRFDNRLFHQELAQESSDEAERAVQDAITSASSSAASNSTTGANVRSPGKRKHRSGSTDSLNSVRASIASADGGADMDVEVPATDAGAGAGTPPPSYHLVAGLSEDVAAAPVHEISLSADEAAAATIDRPYGVEMTQLNNGAQAVFGMGGVARREDEGSGDKGPPPLPERRPAKE